MISDRKPGVVVLESNYELCKVYKDLLADDFTVNHFLTLAEIQSSLDRLGAVGLVVTELELKDGSLRSCSPLIMSWLQSVPVLLVTHYEDIQSVYGEIKNWADDFLDKPFNNATLLAKCHYLVKEPRLFVPEPEHMVIIRNSQVSRPLTAKEFRFLSLLASSENYQIPIDDILDVMWNSEAPYQRVHTLLSRLRPKINELNIKIEVSRDGIISAWASHDYNSK